jgi:hypothetical protein
MLFRLIAIKFCNLPMEFHTLEFKLSPVICMAYVSFCYNELRVLAYNRINYM